MLLRQVAGQAALTLVVDRDGVDAFGCLIDISETKEATAVGQKATGPGVLDHDWLSACQITKSPIADPGVLETDTRWLRATELPEGIPDVALIIPRRRCDVPSFLHTPAVLAQHRAFAGAIFP